MTYKIKIGYFHKISEKKSTFWVWRTFFKKGHFKNVQKSKGPFKMEKFFFEKVIFLGDALKNYKERKYL